MKRITTIRKEIVENEFSLLQEYGESRINSYFNFLRDASRNTFIFREFVSLYTKNEKFMDALRAREFYLVLFDNKIYACKNISNFYYLQNNFTSEEETESMIEDYNFYLEQY